MIKQKPGVDITHVPYKGGTDGVGSKKKKPLKTQ